MQDEAGRLDELMNDDDWALIFGPNGEVKGVFIPEGKEPTDVPHVIEAVLLKAGIDMHTSRESTLH
mgnify:FL=1|jgi:hypothetical protein|tara:strand:+ start:866 stop:1063 length:198 start_codon:yes stop_codon:yes gene_type:complete